MHGKVQKRNQKQKRLKKTTFQECRFPIRSFRRCHPAGWRRSQAFPCCRCFPTAICCPRGRGEQRGRRGQGRSPVTRFFHCADNPGFRLPLIRQGIADDGHDASNQIDFHFPHSRNFPHGFFHMIPACGAAHSADLKEVFLHCHSCASPSSSPSFPPSPAPPSPVQAPGRTDRRSICHRESFLLMEMSPHRENCAVSRRHSGRFRCWIPPE